MLRSRALRHAAAALACAVLARAACLADDLSLRQAEALALHSPSIDAGRRGAEAATHAARGARALANPEVQVAPTVAGTAGSDAEVLLSQPLEVNGTRRVRARIADREAEAAGHEAEAAARVVLLETRQSYWTLVAAQEQLRLANEDESRLEALRAAVQKQVDVGTAPGTQVLKAEVELARARQLAVQADLARSQSRIALNAVLGRPAAAETRAADPLLFTALEAEPGVLEAEALAQRPEVAAAMARVDASRERIVAERLRQWPDLALQARRETFHGDAGLAVALTLPVLDWGSARATRRQAEALAEQEKARSLAVRRQVSAEVAASLQAVRSLGRVVREYETGIVARSEQLAALAQKGYERGATGYLEVLEAQRTLRSVRSEYIGALADHARAVAHLEWAVGRPLRSTPPREVTP